MNTEECVRPRPSEIARVIHAYIDHIPDDVKHQLAIHGLTVGKSLRGGGKGSETSWKHHLIASLLITVAITGSFAGIMFLFGESIGRLYESYRPCEGISDQVVSYVASFLNTSASCEQRQRAFDTLRVSLAGTSIGGIAFVKSKYSTVLKWVKKKFPMDGCAINTGEYVNNSNASDNELNNESERSNSNNRRNTTVRGRILTRNNTTSNRRHTLRSRSRNNTTSNRRHTLRSRSRNHSLNRNNTKNVRRRYPLRHNVGR